VFSILAHRANVHGPDSASENRVTAVRTALAHGWGLEIDIRRAIDGRMYVAHDPAADIEGLEAGPICAAIRQHPAALVALNLKEIGWEAALVDLLEREDLIDQVFVFDMELIEPEPGRTASRLRDLHPSLRLAARVSDRNEPLSRALAVAPTSVIWLDEFDGPWCAADDIARLKDAGRAVYAVSPELHGRSLAEARDRWRFFLDAGVDGICTDYPAELGRLLEGARDGRVMAQ
jgi:hypothetical protein